MIPPTCPFRSTRTLSTTELISGGAEESIFPLLSFNHHTYLMSVLCAVFSQTVFNIIFKMIFKINWKEGRERREERTGGGRGS
jgi:hypothetical protein